MVGLDSGELQVWTKPSSIDETSWEKILTFPKYLSHSLTVRRIRFRKTENTFNVASCGNDNTVRMFELAF
jgi:hypothetical protein